MSLTEQAGSKIHRKALLLINRKARRGQDDFTEIRNRLTSGGLEITAPAADEDMAEFLLRHHQAADLIIVGGGDGTINRMLKGLLEARLPFGVLPLGTANDFARTLGLPTDPLLACDVILEGRTQQIDVGLVNECPFVNVASIGLAAEVTRRLSRGTKTHWGVLAYAWAAIGAMIRSRPFSVEIECDAKTVRTRSWQIAVGNGRNYGGGMTIHENARIDDGLLDLYSLEVKRRWHVLPLIPALIRGALDPVLPVRTLHATAFQIRPLHRIRSIVADGEPIGSTPANFQLLPRVLTVFVPDSRSD
jgi:YegS/Rv2252/BmrU family lipid kinase